MSSTDPYLTITEPTFAVRLFLDSTIDTEESVANVDAFVDLPDGSSWALTIVTVDEVRRLLALWKETGEVADGSYFWAVDQLIVPEPGVSAMTRAIRELVRSGEIAVVGVRCKDSD
ncbi:hypothetical protein ACQEVZ_40935 [Dactylosporangium sp. CA-152071]|uniref:hypothetical protein n=1 Tax=Dactylosporangium sp. CA-152071 TaxID=3239933 RepID=UPI003D8C1B7C